MHPTTLMKIALAVLSILVLSACTDPTEEFYQSGLQAESSGDITLALNEFRSAAEGGHMPSMKKIVLHQQHNPPADTLKWLNILSDVDAESRLHLADFYANKGYSNFYDPKRAFRLYMLSASERNAEAMFKVGLFYFQPPLKQTPPYQFDIKKARHWFNRAQQYGHHSEALDEALLLVTLYDDLEIIYKQRNRPYTGFITTMQNAEAFGPDASVLAKTGIKKLTDSLLHLKPRAGIEELKAAAKENDSVAIIWLGKLYEYGVYFKKNHQRAKEHYQQSHDLGNPVASLQLAKLYLHNTTNRKKAIDLILSAIKNGYTAATFYLTPLLIEDNKLDEAEARLQTLVNKGNPEAHLRLALFYLKNRRSADHDHILELVNKSWQLGYLNSSLYMSTTFRSLYQSQNGTHPSTSYLKIAAERGNKRSHALLCADEIDHPNSKNIQSVMNHCKIAIQYGNTEIYHLLSQLYLMQGFLFADLLKAKHYLMTAYNIESIPAIHDVAFYHLKGYLGFEKNSERAKQLFMKAANRGWCMSMGFTAALAEAENDNKSCFFWSTSMALIAKYDNVLKLRDRCGQHLSHQEKTDITSAAKDSLLQNTRKSHHAPSCNRFIYRNRPAYNIETLLNIKKDL